MTTVASVRRTAAILALAFASLGAAVLTARPAAAHVCATPSLVKVGQPSAVTVGITAEQVAVDGIEIRIPTLFSLKDATSSPGWTLAEQTKSVVRYTGGSVQPFQCGYFTLHGTATRHATFSLPLVLHYADGSSKTFANDQLGEVDSGQMIFAGTDPDPATASKGMQPWQLAIVLVIALVGIAVAIVVVRRAIAPPTSGGRR